MKYIEFIDGEWKSVRIVCDSWKFSSEKEAKLFNQICEYIDAKTDSDIRKAIYLLRNIMILTDNIKLDDVI